MKKIILIPFLFIATFCFAQYPNGIQTLGNDSNMVVAKGGFTAKGGVQVANYVDTTAANLSRIRQYSGATIFTTSDNVFWVRNGTATAWLKIGSNVSPAGTDCSLIGGIVTPATGLTFDITMASYCISDTPHVYSGGQITLDAADASLPRIDVIGLDNTGNAFKITGIPATDPAVPQVDPSTQLYLTHVYISAGATTPTGVSSYTIWDENTEWTGSATGVTVDFNNTSTVYHLTKSTDVGIHTTNDLVSYAGSGVHLQGYNVVKFFINLKSAMPANRNISIGLFTNSQPMTNYLTLGAAHGFNKSLVGQWQVVSVPLTDFNYLSESPLTGLKFRIQGAGAGFYLDWITLNGGLPINTGSNAITNVYRIAGTTNVMKVVNGVASLAFVDSVGGGSADSIVVVQQPLQSLPSGVSGVPDTLKFNADSSGLVKDIYKKAGTDSIFQKINGVDLFAYKDSVGSGAGGGFDTSYRRLDSALYKINGIEKFSHLVIDSNALHTITTPNDTTLRFSNLRGNNIDVNLNFFDTWSRLGSNIYRSSGNVGIGVDTPSAKLTIVSNNLANEIVPANGLMLQNNTPATASVQSQSSPLLGFRANTWNTSTLTSNPTQWYILSRGVPSAAAQSDLIFNYSNISEPLRINQSGLTVPGGLSVSGTTTVGFLNATSGGQMQGMGWLFGGLGAINPSSYIEIRSTTKGFLMPRQTSTQRNAIASPATGLQVYDSTQKTNYTYDGTAWQSQPIGKTVISSGTGATTISVAHGLTGITSSSQKWVTANNAASAGISYVTIDATNINIVYSVAPASGTDNLSYDILIKP